MKRCTPARPFYAASEPLRYFIRRKKSVTAAGEPASREVLLPSEGKQLPSIVQH